MTMTQRHLAKFNMNDVQYVIKGSSNKLEEQGRILGRQAITLMKNTTDGVNMVRKETMMEAPEFLLTGEGLMENAIEEELKSFLTEWKRLMQEGEAQLRESMYELGMFMVHGGSKEFPEIVDHFFPDLQN